VSQGLGKQGGQVLVQLGKADDEVGAARALLATWRGWFIAAFLIVQFTLPLHYYLARRDPHDERFAWRMFSPMRLARCAPKFAIDGKPVNLAAQFHEAWIELAQRGRFVIVEAMAAQLCRQRPGAHVVVSLDCTYLDREPRTWGGHDLCADPEL
jgi:hypothetical protein